MVLRNSSVGKSMNAVVVIGSAANGLKSLVDLKRIWNNCGGGAVEFDIVLQQATTGFREQGGDGMLELVTLRMSPFNFDGLQRSIGVNGDAVMTTSRDAHVRQFA